MNESHELDIESRFAPTEAQSPAKAKCDGNHGGPRCGDPECWNDSPPADALAALTELVRLMRPFYPGCVAGWQVEWGTAWERARRVVDGRSDVESTTPVKLSELRGLLRPDQVAQPDSDFEAPADWTEPPLLAQVLDALRIGRTACEWAEKHAEVEKIAAAFEAARALAAGAPAPARPVMWRYRIRRAPADWQWQTVVNPHLARRIAECKGDAGPVYTIEPLAVVGSWAASQSEQVASSLLRRVDAALRRAWTRGSLPADVIPGELARDCHAFLNGASEVPGG